MAIRRRGLGRVRNTALEGREKRLNECLPVTIRRDKRLWTVAGSDSAVRLSDGDIVGTGTTMGSWVDRSIPAQNGQCGQVRPIG
jgi:hypothetical protein